jgi:type II secretory pathway component GspD/PulD (secretin)
VRVQVKIIALHKSQVGEGVVPKDEAKSELLFPSMERLKQLEESGSATSITRAEVVTGSGLEASWQDGEAMLVPVGRTQNGFTRSGREGVPVPSMAVNYQQERVGTMIRVTPRIHGETIVANLTLEQSVVPPFELKEPDATAAPQPLQRTHTVKSTVPLRPGAPLIVGGYQSISLKNGQPTETFHVVVMSAQILP